MSGATWHNVLPAALQQQCHCYSRREQRQQAEEPGDMNAEDDEERRWDVTGKPGPWEDYLMAMLNERGVLSKVLYG